MKIYGIEITEAQIEACLKRMRSHGEFMAYDNKGLIKREDDKLTMILKFRERFGIDGSAKCKL